MASQVGKAPPRARRTNEERSAETRNRLVEATVDCLNRYGYAGTTTILVSDTSRVTRGGMLHHFPSKVEMLIATAEYCLERMSEERRTRSALQNNAVILEVERGRFGVALTEIMIGSRSDAELAQRFKPVAEKMLSLQRQSAARIAESDGVSDVTEVEALVWLTMAAIRGMTLMQLAGVDPGLTDRALRMIGRTRRHVIERLREEEAEGKTG
jgi:AcrR family transcriptional regulator